MTQPDAGAALTKGLQRVLATLIGGIVGIALVSVFGDQPWIRVPMLGAIGAAGIFFFRTTTAPYVPLLGSLTAIIIVSAARGTDPSAAIAVGLWRVVLIVGGVVIGTGAQLLLWPSDPEATLLDILRARLTAVARTVRGLGTEAPAAERRAARAAHVVDLGGVESGVVVELHGCSWKGPVTRIVGRGLGSIVSVSISGASDTVSSTV